MKLCQTNYTHDLWDGELYDGSGEKIILNKDGAPIASGRWSYRGLENHANKCYEEGVQECYTNNTHFLLDDELFLRNPDGKLVKVSHPSEQPKAEASSNKIFLKEGLKGNVGICEKPPGVQRCEINGTHYLVDDALYLIDPENPRRASLIPDAPAPVAQTQLIFGYDSVEKFLIFSSIAISAGTFACFMVEDVIPFTNRVYNQALTHLASRQVLAQLAFVTAAAAEVMQSSPSILPSKITKYNNIPHPNFIKTLTSPEKLSAGSKNSRRH